MSKTKSQILLILFAEFNFKNIAGYTKKSFNAELAKKLSDVMSHTNNIQKDKQPLFYKGYKMIIRKNDGVCIINEQSHMGIKLFLNGNNTYFFEGTLENNQPKNGTRTIGNTTYTGEFQGGHLINGTITYSNGDTYEGKCSQSIPHGCGELVSITGLTFSGTFNMGKFKDGTFINNDTNEPHTSEKSQYRPSSDNIRDHHGTIYSGDFKDGQLTDGVITYLKTGRKND